MNFAIIGASGNVGRKTIEILEKSKITIDNLFLVASSKSSGKKFKFNNDSPLNDSGIFESYHSEIDGKHIWEVNKLIPKILSEKKSNEFNYAGYIEGNKIMSGDGNVIVTDGFTGNIALKTAEGTANFIMKEVKNSMTSNLYGKVLSFLNIKNLKNEGDSVGGIIKCIIKNCPTGLGEPVFDKIEALLAHTMMSIPATKGFEIGSGFNCATQNGSNHNDVWMFNHNNQKPMTKTNNNGGVIGGISNGMDIVFKVAFKPPATILKTQTNIQQKREEIKEEVIQSKPEFKNKYTKFTASNCPIIPIHLRVI